MKRLTTDEQAHNFINSGVLDNQDIKFIQECQKLGATELEAANKLIDEYKRTVYAKGWTFDEHAANVNDASVRASKA